MHKQRQATFTPRQLTALPFIIITEEENIFAHFVRLIMIDDQPCQIAEIFFQPARNGT